IAVAGTGGVSRYLIEGLLQHGHTVVNLTRKSNSSFGDQVITRVTDYSVQDLIQALDGCDGIVSTVSDNFSPQVYTVVHLALLEACKSSPRCKHFIINGWTGNIQDFPDQPIGSDGKRKPVLEALQAQNEVQWTVILIAWFMDYVIPKQNRYFQDIGGLYPLDWSCSTFRIWGHGKNKISMTSARDVGKSVASLFDYELWENYTFVQGDSRSWTEIYEIVKEHYGGKIALKLEKKSLAQSVKAMIEGDGPRAKFEASFEIASNSGALELPQDKVKEQQKKYFQGIQYERVGDLL
ncbi:NAD(P)-binding protein, partial [Cadophora sp. DSE1049]